MISSAINIGRRRGEFEGAKKLMTAIKAGRRDPDRFGVPSIAGLADLARQASAFANGQNKEGRLLRGVPDERWQNDTATDPLPALDPEKLWVFLPETKATRIRQGHVYAGANDRLLAWTEPELFAHLGTGYRVLIRWDPTEPTLGAAIFNHETGSRNTGSYALGLFLGVAEYQPRAPQITACQGFTDDDNQNLKKRYDAVVRSEYRAIGVFGRAAPMTAECRDGRGAVQRIERGIDASPSLPRIPSLEGPRRATPSRRERGMGSDPDPGVAALRPPLQGKRILSRMELIDA